MKPRRRDAIVGVLLSFRQADALLRARNGTVAHLVQRGVLRAVPWFDGRRIPRGELERLASTGITPSGRRARPRPVRTTGTVDPEALRRLDVEGL